MPPTRRAPAGAAPIPRAGAPSGSSSTTCWCRTRGGSGTAPARTCPAPTTAGWSPSWRCRSALAGERLADALGQHEAHVLAQDLERLHLRRAAVPEEADEPLDERVGCAGAGGDADDALAVDPR